MCRVEFEEELEYTDVANNREIQKRSLKVEIINREGLYISIQTAAAEAKDLSDSLAVKLPISALPEHKRKS